MGPSTLMRAVTSASLSVFLAGGAAQAADYLTTVQSEVYQTTGTHQEIARRATTCITQNIKPGFTTAPTIVSSDLEGGIIVANNAFTYSAGWIPVSYRARTTLTFEARDGRFRITHTNIENFNEMRGGDGAWGPIGLWMGAGGESAQKAIVGITAIVARCVQSPPTTSDEW